MKSFYSFFAGGLLAILLLAGGRPAVAQAPAWQSAQAVAVATTATAGNTSNVRATAVDVAGNVFMAGHFTNTVVLGGTTLTSVGSTDIFVAKFNPVSNQFVWAQRAGGTGDDQATALAVSGNNVYVAGYFVSTTADFGTSTVGNAGNNDLFVAKLTDAGSTGSFVWAEGYGGAGYDRAFALAVSGTSVYVAGTFDYSPGQPRDVRLTQVFVAKLTDAGTVGVFVWTVEAGGSGGDYATALAVSGTNVYVAGAFNSPYPGIANVGANAGGFSGTYDLFVAKVTDAGSTGRFVWAERAGGTASDEAHALAVSGTSVYVAGYFSNYTVSFGAATLASAGVSDMFVAKLTDAGNTGSFVWAQRAGGTASDEARALTVSGTSVYVAGVFGSLTADFGAATLASAGVSDMFVAKLTDAGNTASFAWAQRAGGTGSDQTTALAVSATSVYVAGNFQSPTVGFGPATLTNPSQNTPLGFLASLTDPTLTATTAAPPREPLTISPNPAQHTATLRLPAGTPPAPLTLTDAQGRTVRRYPAPAGPAATLDLRGLPTGLYLLGGAGRPQRLLVE